MIKLFLLLSILTLQTLFAKNPPQDEIKKAEKNLPAQCIFYFKMYLNAKGPKAFVYAIDSSDKVTCRFSANAKNQKQANENALFSCQTSSLEKEILSDCKFYTADSNISKSKKKLSFEEKYLVNLNKIQKEKKSDLKKLQKKKALVKTAKKESKQKPKKIKKVKKQVDLNQIPKKCIMFYKIFKEAPKHKAFAFTSDSAKKYACKYSAKSTSEKRAKKVALASCEKSRKKRHIKNPCQIFQINDKIVETIKPKKKTKKEKKPTKKPIKKVEKKVTKKVNPKKSKKKSTSKVSTSLQKAILNANLKKIKQLIEKGEDINTKARDKASALFVAVAQGDMKFVKKLLDLGADPYVRKKDGNNLLVAAIMSGSSKMLKLMLEQGIDPNLNCEEGNTPLHFALMMFDDAMMKTLYSFGSLDDIPNKKGKSVQDLAKELSLDLERIRR